MRTTVLFFIFSFLWISSFAQQSFTLKEAQEYGVKNNLQIKLKQLDIADADGQITETKAIGMPKVSAGVAYQYFPQLPQFLLPAQFFNPNAPEGEFTAIDAGTRQTLVGNIQANAVAFDGSYLVALKAVKLYKELVRKEINQTEFEIRNGVTKSYLAVLIAIQSRALIDLNITNLKKVLAETKIIYENGFLEKLDVDRLTFSLENLLAEQRKSTELINLSYNLLKFQMGYPLDEDIAVVGDLEEMVNIVLLEKVEVTAEVDYTQRPEYAVIQLGQELNKINIRRWKAGYLPSLYAFVNHQQALNRNNLFDNDETAWLPTTVVGLNLNIPIYDGGDKKGKIQRARIAYDKTEIQKKQFEQAMTLEISNAYLNYANAKETLESTKRSLDLAQRIYDTTQIKYKEGVGASLEVTQAESDLYGAQGRYVSALYDLVVAKTNIDIALGK